jgi:hypothetical protein
MSTQKLDFNFNLLSFFEANIPIIYIQTNDFYNLDNLINKLFPDIEILEYLPDNELLDFKTKKSFGKIKLQNFLKLILDNQNIAETIVILKDPFQINENNISQFYLKNIALKKLYQEKYNITFFIVSNSFKIPINLKEFISPLQFSPPDFYEILELVNKFQSTLFLNLDQSEIKAIATSLQGLERLEILKKLNLDYQQDGKLTIHKITKI